MNFTILNRWGDYPASVKNHVYLTWDDWNDYSFYTLFGIFYIDEAGIKHDLGGVKIGFVNQKEHQRVYKIGVQFTNVGEGFFSLGTSEEYYEELNKIDPDARDEILISLNDLARNKQLFEVVRTEPVVIKSLLRDISPSTVTGQLKRMAEGGAKLTSYSFSFALPASSNEHALILEFDVVPESMPPTNVHVLIGRNGVGKTYIINSMVDSLIKEGNRQTPGGTFQFRNNPIENEPTSFANLISISFSAFDEMEPRTASTTFNFDIIYSYIGLKTGQIHQNHSSLIKTHDELAADFVDSLRVCASRLLSKRWIQAVTTLQSDPNFREAGIEELIGLVTDVKSRSSVLKIFKRLSSGHKIVLLTITRLIERLQERSLVIMDEPEAHLHPPLLSAFIRAVSDLLIMTNGVSIVATRPAMLCLESAKKRSNYYNRKVSSRVLW
jgi:ABC-type branched-subunit amino acid transport system ATPase component/DNA-binding transcriptional ArsR family regulator